MLQYSILQGAGFGTSHPGRFSLNFGLFGDFQSIVDFNTQVSNGAFKLGMPEQQLDGPQILGPTIDQTVVPRLLHPGPQAWNH